MDNAEKNEIYLKANSNWEFFLIHGYTGCPPDFNDLPEYLHKKFNANVRIPNLPGHSTKVEDLYGLRFNDFYEYVENKLKKDIASGKKIILGGYSFGAQLALILAAKYPVKGVFIISDPSKKKFPLNSPKLKFFMKFKKKIKKRIMIPSKEYLKKINYYSYMPLDILPIVEEAAEKEKNNLSKITAPIMIVNFKKDFLSDYKYTEVMKKNLKSKKIVTLLFKHKMHNMFYSEKFFEFKEKLTSFLEECIFESRKDSGVSAIIPAYNEYPRISNVLKVLSNMKIFESIVVVDDGSVDNTGEIVQKFKNVKYLRNEKNMGKGYSMERGVNATRSDIIFFCDADLNGLKSEDVLEMIKPVMERKVDMFIGIRKNLMQRAVHLFALNSGERAVRREIWQKLPSYYKHKYQIEAGLNYFVKHYWSGYDFKVFDYYQILKEKKYGFFKGFSLRWRLNFNVFNAYISCIFMKYLSKKQTNFDYKCIYHFKSS
ncbi:MAG TPA: alpha/beta fold hydrolase [Candidatus Nanoarchaeia archaeon]|nr:alpha/beta fold hydrolase [Candidatus Nanoarchaeia archaeon]